MQALLERIVIRLGNSIARTKSLFWCMIFSGLCVGFSTAPYLVFRRLLAGGVIDGLSKAIPAFVPIYIFISVVAMIYIMQIGVRFLCRGIQLCFPDKLKAYEATQEVNL